jgi:uncharacterized membrane protein YeaQ/YmgE (transglycosylase-associated protein family)
MGIIITCIVGLIVGVVAKLLMPGRDPGGWFVTMLLGIAGSWVGSFLSAHLGMGASVGWIGSIIGAMILLAVYRLAQRV